MPSNKKQSNKVLISIEEKSPFIKISGDKPSRFVIDLKLKQAEEEQAERIKAENKLGYKLNSILVSGKTNLVKINKKVALAGKGIVTQTGRFVPDSHGQAATSALSLNLSLINILPLRLQNILNQLALVDILKLLFFILLKVWRLIYRLSYLVGYLTVFISRFFYFLALALIKLAGDSVKLIRPEVFQLYYSTGKAIYFVWLKAVWVYDIIRQKVGDIFHKSKQGVSELSPVKHLFFTRSIKPSTVNNLLPSISKAVLFNGVKVVPEKIIPGLERENFRLLPRPKFLYAKNVAIFAFILFVLILPIKALTYYKSLDNLRGKVLGISEQAVNQLFIGGEQAMNQQFDQAEQSFSQAGANFLAALDQLKEINGLIFAIAAILPSNDLKLAAASKNIVAAGQLSAELGENLSKLMTGLLQMINQPASSTIEISQVLENFSATGMLAANKAQELTQQLRQIDGKILPIEYREQFDSLKQKADVLTSGLSEFSQLADKLQIFLGMDQDKRYLLVFQNNAELRASGGFLGSFAVLDLKQGKIKNLSVPVGGSYDTEAGLLTKVAAPEPLWLVNPLWHFWDANWWFDWPTTARKLAWFYENSGGSTVDGVISLTPTVMEELLKIIGPVDLSKDYGSTALTTGGSTALTTGGLVITADNFWLETQKLAEQKPPQTNQPKKIIGDLLNQIINELPKRINQDNLLPLIKLIEASTGDKNILFYFFDPEMQKQITDLGWEGGIKDTAQDYLAVINSNIAGGKSDRKISQTIDLETEIMPDGSIIDNLTVTRNHNGIKREPFCGVRNVNWLRIYVPQGSELISAQGFKPVDQIYFEPADPTWRTDETVAAGEAEAAVDQASGTKIYNELGKTVFANWSQVDPGESTQIYLKYKLPFKLSLARDLSEKSLSQKLADSVISVLNPTQRQLYPYSLLVQKQPGMNASTVRTALKVNSDYNIVWKYPAGLTTDQTSWQAEENLDQDKYWAVLLEE